MNESDKILERILTSGRKTVEVEPAELAEARNRRTRLGQALEVVFPGVRVYPAGSIAHGDALTPLTDVDLGGVVPDPAHRYGPGLAGPRRLMEQAREAICGSLVREYPRLTVTIEGQNHAVLVRFGDPVTAGQPDFTADVIVALDNPDAAGLYIPALRPPIGWERSDPESHNRMIKTRNDDSRIAFAHVVRLLKHWARTHGDPLCSWHVKVLALQCITNPTTQLDGLTTWFTHSAAALLDQPTPDPVGVNPAGVALSQPLDSVLRQIHDAIQILTSARAEAQAGRTANGQKLLAELLPGAVDTPDVHEVRREATASALAAGVPTSLVTTTARTAPLPGKSVRSWRP